MLRSGGRYARPLRRNILLSSAKLNELSFVSTFKAELVSRMSFPSQQAAKSAIFEYLGPSTTPAGCIRHWATGAAPIPRRVEWETLRSHKVNVPVLVGDSRPRPLSGVGFGCRGCVFGGSPLIVLANSLNNLQDGCKDSKIHQDTSGSRRITQTAQGSPPSPP